MVAIGRARYMTQANITAKVSTGSLFYPIRARAAGCLPLQNYGETSVGYSKISFTAELVGRGKSN